MNTVPDRWEKYQSCGIQIPSTNFIAFKTPLRQTICDKLRPEQRFTPTTLISMVPNLGMVVDLTNTTRYYDKTEFLQQGLHYEKINCQGQMVPSSYTVRRFCEVVDLYLQNTGNSGKLIGVHCTHGINRTGYLVCRYMIDRLNITPKDAVHTFNEARGHHIERPNYIAALHGHNSSRNGVPSHGSPRRPSSGNSDMRNGWYSSTGNYSHHQYQPYDQQEQTSRYDQHRRPERSSQLNQYNQHNQYDRRDHCSGYTQYNRQERYNYRRPSRFESYEPPNDGYRYNQQPGSMNMGRTHWDNRDPNYTSFETSPRSDSKMNWRKRN